MKKIVQRSIESFIREGKREDAVDMAVQAYYQGIFTCAEYLKVLEMIDEAFITSTQGALK